MNVSMFSFSLGASKLILPTTAWTMPPLSLRNSTLPALYSLTTLATSGVTVPARGEGIRPRGPSTLPERADQAHHVRRGDAHVELGPAVLDLLGQVFLADDVGAGGLGGFGQVALGEHGHALRLADAVRQHDRAADDLVGLLGIDPQAHVDLDRLVELGRAEFLQLLDGRRQRTGVFVGAWRRGSIAFGLLCHGRC